MATVLVVDDEPAVRDVVRITLEMAGHRVVTACDGSEALQAVGDRPDLVVLDVMMPDMEGWEVLTRIKSMPDSGLSQIPVIMLTARDDDLDRIRGGIEGAIRYLAKPFSPGQLREEVAWALEGEAEPLKRRRAQASALESLARLEVGREATNGGSGAQPRPRLTRLERAPEPRRPTPPRLAPEALRTLSPKQRELLDTVSSSSSVRQAAERLEVSRSNVYASLRRIAGKLGMDSVPTLLVALRAGELPSDAG